MKLQLLSDGKNNTKIGKNDIDTVRIFSLNLRPYTLPYKGKVMNVCPFASAACAAACVGKNGHFSMSNGRAQKAQIRKTNLFHNSKHTFYKMLYHDMYEVQEYCNDRGITPVFRLNAYSDINHSSLSKIVLSDSLYNLFPEAIFYDYTKDVKKCLTSSFTNYSLTYSLSERSEADLLKHSITFDDLREYVNIAVVFEKLPDFYKGIKVINGDTTDNRFLDPANCIVGLKFKGSKAKLLQGIASGFVVPAFKESIFA